MLTLSQGVKLPLPEKRDEYHKHNATMDNIRKRIKSDEISKIINIEKQNRHIRNGEGYVEGRSYLYDGVNAQELVNIYHGTGEVKFTENGRWKNKEIITVNKNIGASINPMNGEAIPTNKFVIHYSKTGTHVVPTGRG